jgi:hypothetical protein
MRRLYTILTLNTLLILIIPCSLTAQHQAHSSANISATVLPAVGVEVQVRTSSTGEKGNIQSEFLVKVNDTGKYSLRIVDESNTSSTPIKVLEVNNIYRLQGRKLSSKKIVQVALLSS